MLPTDCSPALACPMRGHGDWWGCEAAGSQSQAAGVPPHSPCARSKSPPPPPTFCPPTASSMSTQVLCVSPAGQVGEARAGGGWGWWRAWACGRCGTGALPSIRGRVFASPFTFFVNFMLELHVHRVALWHLVHPALPARPRPNISVRNVQRIGMGGVGHAAKVGGEGGGTGRS